MRTAIASQSSVASAPIDRHFGKCDSFFIFDDESGRIETIENPGKRLKSCPGGVIVDKLVQLKVNRVIAGDFGTNVQQILNHRRIQMVIHPDTRITVGEILGQLSAASGKHVRKKTYKTYKP